MTKPDVPLRFELTFEVPGTPDQVWEAIATAKGISGWFLTTDLEEREGGEVRFHMGETSSDGSITAWEPPHRLVYEEPAWAELAGRDPASVTPLVSEFVVEAESGGTCVVRVVSSAFGTGADWEQEFFAGMERGWSPHFDALRLYLTRFPGQAATRLWADARLRGTGAQAWDALSERIGRPEVGSDVEVLDLRGRVHALRGESAVIDVSEPHSGYVILFADTMDDETAVAIVQGWFFSEGAGSYVDDASPAWTLWLEELGEPVAASPPASGA